jgi:hypothetical protein
MTNITTEQFEKKLQEQKDSLNATKWRDLNKDQIYTITSADYFTTQYGEACVIELSDKQKVWAPSGLAKRLKQNKNKFPCFVRPTGLIQSHKNPAQSYYGFDLV